MPELRHLRYFVAVAEECHFGRAAQRLHIAQPPLSLQIQHLEQDLGVELLRRSTRKVELTAAGQHYLKSARAILASVDEAAVAANRVAAGEIGTLSVGFTGSATYELLPALVRSLRAELPDITVEPHGEMLTPDQVRALGAGRLDLGFLRPPVSSTALTVHTLRSEALVAVLPERHPLAEASTVRVADLRAEPFIGYPSGHRSVVHDAVLAACAQAGFQPSRLQEVTETATLVVFVAAGLGVALVPASVRHLQVTGAVYRPLADSATTVDLAIAVRAGDDSPILRRVLEKAKSLV